MVEIKEVIKSTLGQRIIEWKEVSPKRVYCSIDKKNIYECVKLLFKDFGLRFCTASGIDIPGGFEILYHFSADRTGEIYSLRIKIDTEPPTVDSITPLFPGAEWIEREMWELLGIQFSGHPNLKRLLLADEWPQGEYPLRRSNKDRKE